MDFEYVPRVLCCYVYFNECFDCLLTDDAVKNVLPSYFNLPALDISTAFPQATPASTFPPCGNI